MQFRKRLLSSPIALLVSAAGLLACMSAKAQTPVQGILDWVPRAQLTEELQKDLPAVCCGRYVEPEREAGSAEMEPGSGPTFFASERNVSRPESWLTMIEGPARIEQGFRSLQSSQSSIINQNDNTITLTGEVVFREPGILLYGASALIDQASEISQLNEANYVLHANNVHGSANRILLDSANGVITIENGEFSRCEPGDEFWLLRARNIRLDPANGKGYATAVSLRISDIPVFYYPFTLPFPIGDERVSGFLAPSVSNSSDDGIDLAIPYYANLAPHFDATLTPRLISERGAMASAELRYLASWSMNTVNMSLMPKDKFFDPALASIPGSDSPPAEKRWFTGFEHQGQLGANWSTFIDYSAVSDQNYFRDLGSRGLNVESRTHLNKQGQLNFHTNNWRASTRVQRIELIDPLAASIDINKPFDRLPEFQLAGDFRLADSIEYGFQANHVSFERSLDNSLLAPAQIANGALVTGQRLSVEPHIRMPLRTPGTWFIPSASYRYTSWDLQDQAVATDANPQIGVGVFTLDSGLIFERPINFAANRFTQTLEPRLYYLRSEFEAQDQLPNFDTAQLNFGFNQLFRNNRFTGGDRVADANQLTAALTSRMLDEQGRERVRLSIGQIFFFEDRKVTLDSPLQSWQLLQPLHTPRSALSAELDYRLPADWRIRTDLQWNEDTQRLDEGSVAFHYQSSANRIFNLAYRYRENVDVFLPAPPQIDPRIKQTDVSGVWPVNDNWRLLGRWNYDYSNRRNLETFAGVEYSNCCATIRLVAREWIDQYEYLLLRNKPNRGIFFQLTLNGLGNVTDGGISRLLEDGIVGFKEYEINE